MSVHPIRGEDSHLPVADAAACSVALRGVVALTTDPSLIRALQDLSTAGVDVSVVSDLRRLTDEVMQRSGGAALIDAEALDTPIQGVVDAIARQLPDLRLMVAGHSAEQQQLASRIASQTVFRFVHKPVSPQRLKLFLDSAARPTDQTGTFRTLAATSELPAISSPSGTGRFPLKPAMVGVAVLVVALSVWGLWPSGNPPAVAPVAPPVAIAPAGAPPDTASLIKLADAASASGRFVASDGSSAAELYRAALKLDPRNRQASEGYARAIDQALRRAEESLLASRWNEAGNIVAAVSLIAPENPRLAFLNAQLARELARVNSDVSQRQVFEAQQMQIRASLATMKERLQRGTLVEPAANAISSFREAEAINANDAEVRSARETLVAALLTAADVELAARRPAGARRLVDAARSVNSNAPGIDVLNRRVDEVSAQLATPEPASAVSTTAPAPRVEPPAPVAVVAAPLVTAPSPAPAEAAPAPVRPAVDEIISARKLQVLRSQEPVYPDRALQQLLSGWVELEFTVAKDGSVKDIKVTDAEPKNTFNAAAISALSRFRYAPVIKDGAAVTQRAHLRMRFTAQDPQ